MSASSLWEFVFISNYVYVHTSEQVYFIIIIIIFFYLLHERRRTELGTHRYVYFDLFTWISYKIDEQTLSLKP